MSPRAFTSLRKAWGDREDRCDYRAFATCAALYEVNRDRDKRKEPFTALDFFSPRSQAKRKPTEEDDDEARKRRSMDMLAYVEMLNEAFGGRDLRPTQTVPIYEESAPS